MKSQVLALALASAAMGAAINRNAITRDIFPEDVSDDFNTPQINRNGGIVGDAVDTVLGTNEFTDANGREFESNGLFKARSVPVVANAEAAAAVNAAQAAGVEDSAGDFAASEESAEFAGDFVADEGVSIVKARRGGSGGGSGGSNQGQTQDNNGGVLNGLLGNLKVRENFPNVLPPTDPVAVPKVATDGVVPAATDPIDLVPVEGHVNDHDDDNLLADVDGFLTGEENDDGDDDFERFSKA